MCGIAGIVGQRQTPPTLIDHMLSSIAHRGPDGSGVWRSETGDVILGHRRLSIIDLSDAAAQPMRDDSGRLILTFNGEIYNYKELRSDLIDLGVKFRSSGDTEVILQAYRVWGTDCLKKFNGMFAFALYDMERGILFCGRDRYGEKPFLFSIGDNFFAFASEFKALLQHPGISTEYDEWRLLRGVHNASTGLDSDRQTVFADVQQLLPGEAMELDVRTLHPRIWRYWQIRPEAEQGGGKHSEKASFDEFRELLIDAVRLRMRSDVAVGSCLSGGLDSSAIVCIARHLLGDEAAYHTFTGRFPGTSADEWEYASGVVEAARTSSHIVEPTVDRFLEELPAFMWANELPVGSSSQYAQWSVFRLAKENGVTVLLDGQGADESLGGYEQYFVRYIEALKQTGDTDRLSAELPQIRARYPRAVAPPLRALRDRLPFSVRHALSNRFHTGTNFLYGVPLGVARNLARENALPPAEGFNSLTGALISDSFGGYLTSLLRYGDRNSMAHSREVRLPFCDHRIAEFMARQPPEMLMGEVQTKRLLRESMRGILPETVRQRWNKQGFRPPQDLWFQSKDMVSQVRDVIYSASFRESPYWIAPWWQNVLTRLEGGELSLGWLLWQPFIMEKWKEHFLRPIIRLRDDAAK